MLYTFRPGIIIIVAVVEFLVVAGSRLHRNQPWPIRHEWKWWFSANAARPLPSELVQSVKVRVSVCGWNKFPSFGGRKDSQSCGRLGYRLHSHRRANHCKSALMIANRGASACYYYCSITIVFIVANIPNSLYCSYTFRPVTGIGIIVVFVNFVRLRHLDSCTEDRSE